MSKGCNAVEACWLHDSISRDDPNDCLTSGRDIAYSLKEVFNLERGTITCSLCGRMVVPRGKKLESVTCQHCGHPNVFIRLKYHGKRVFIYTDERGRPHSYATATKVLIDINAQIQARTFDPDEWKASAIKARLFENKLEEWFSRKEKDEERGRIAPSTLGNYKTYKKLYYLTSLHLVGIDVRELRLRHIQSFYDDLSGSPKYRKNIMDGLHDFFRWLKRWGDIADIPTWPEMEEIVQKEKRALSREEQDKALANIPEKHRDIFEFMMEAGLRPSEACALMVVDINIKRRGAIFRRTYSEGKLRNKTKNQRKEYVLVLSDRAWNLVERNMTPDFPFVFRNPDTGGGYKYKFVYRLWKEMSGTSVSIGEATRHSFVTQIIEDGISEEQAMYLTRHVDKRSLKPYYHPTDDKTREALNYRGKPRKVIPIGEGKK